MVPDGQAITDRVLRYVKYCRFMYGVFGVGWLAVKLIDGENLLENNPQRVVTTRCVFSGPIANVL